MANYDADAYHNTDAPTYDDVTDGSLKHNDSMAVVRYEPSHYNPQAPEGKTGSGVTMGRWVFNEEPGKAEGLLQSNIELFMDSSLEPHASIGYHRHTETEEIYYLLSGTLSIELTDENSTRLLELKVGGAHLIKPGQSHYVQAGEEGARFIVVAARV